MSVKNDTKIPRPLLYSNVQPTTGPIWQRFARISRLRTPRLSDGSSAATDAANATDVSADGSAVPSSADAADATIWLASHAELIRTAANAAARLPAASYAAGIPATTPVPRRLSSAAVQHGPAANGTAARLASAKPAGHHELRPDTP